MTYEQLVWDTPVSYDRARVRELFALHWLAAKENVIFCGPVGVGKSWFAQALGHSACRAGHRVRYTKVAKLLQALHASRADNSFERELRGWLAWDLLLLDDFEGEPKAAMHRRLLDRIGPAYLALESDAASVDDVMLKLADLEDQIRQLRERSSEA